MHRQSQSHVWVSWIVTVLRWCFLKNPLRTRSFFHTDGLSLCVYQQRCHQVTFIILILFVQAEDPPDHFVCCH